MISSILDINRRLAENPAAFIAEAEAAYDRQLSKIADHIAAHSEQCPVILLSGPSGSGKTTTALMLERKLDRQGLECHTLSQDNYFRTQTTEDMALLAEGKFDLEAPERVDEELLNAQCMRDEGGGAYSMPITVMNTEVLRGVLKTAIEREDYELAAHLRDVIKERENEGDPL